MSISTVITDGYGSFAGVNFIPTFGYISGAANVVIRDTHDGAPKKFQLPIYVKKGHKKQNFGNLIQIYKEAKEIIPDDVELLEAISPYIDDPSPSIPPVENINLEALLKNEQSTRQFIIAIENIEKRLKILAIQAAKDAEDDELLMVCAMIG